MHDFKTTIGIPKPNEAEAKDAETMDGMRRAILKASRDSGIIRGCLTMAEYNGLSGEDKYLMLAYQALRMLEDQYQLNLQFLYTSPSPAIFLDKSTDQPEGG